MRLFQFSGSWTLNTLLTRPLPPQHLLAALWLASSAPSCSSCSSCTAWGRRTRAPIPWTSPRGCLSPRHTLRTTRRSMPKLESSEEDREMRRSAKDEGFPRLFSSLGLILYVLPSLGYWQRRRVSGCSPSSHSLALATCNIFRGGRKKEGRDDERSAATTSHHAPPWLTWPGCRDVSPDLCHVGDDERTWEISCGLMSYIFFLYFDPFFSFFCGTRMRGKKLHHCVNVSLPFFKSRKTESILKRNLAGKNEVQQVAYAGALIVNIFPFLLQSCV